jgi:hypothetical protein
MGLRKGRFDVEPVLEDQTFLEQLLHLGFKVLFERRKPRPGVLNEQKKIAALLLRVLQKFVRKPGLLHAEINVLAENPGNVCRLALQGFGQKRAAAVSSDAFDAREKVRLILAKLKYAGFQADFSLVFILYF